MKMGALCRKESEGNGSTRGKRSRRPRKVWLDGVRDDIKEKGLSARGSVRSAYIVIPRLPRTSGSKMSGRRTL